MAKLRIAIDDDVLKRARIRARAEGSTVHALVRDYLERYAGDERREALREVVAISRRFAASSRPEGRTWTRDDVHDR